MTMIKRLLSFSLAMLLMLGFFCSFSVTALAGVSGTTIPCSYKVGDTDTLKAGSAPSGWTRTGDYAWTTSNYRAVRITGRTDRINCDIEVVGTSSSPVIVRCTIYIQQLRNGYLYYSETYTDYEITISENSSGPTGSYTISGPKSPVSIDLANNVPLEITCGVAFSPNSVYLRFNATDGNPGYGDFTYDSNKAYFNIYPDGMKNGACKIELIKVESSYTSIKDSLTIRYSVSCSHYYGNGTVIVEPTYTSEGTKRFTCRYCGETKTEAIPKLTPPSSYTVSYDANGGSGAPASQTKTPGEALTLSNTIPTHLNTSAGSYTVTLDPNGGSVSQGSLSANCTTSYTFKNWNTKKDGSGTNYNPGGSYTADANATLFAQWNTKTETEAVTLPTPTRSGWTFKYWGTSGSATSGYTGSYTPSKSETLVAVWEQAGVAINATNFPDAIFRSYVQSSFDKNGDGSLSQVEIAAVTIISCQNKNISSLKGVELFTKLSSLYCYNNQLSSLDVSKNTALKTLSCYGNQLTSLNISKNTALQSLSCSNNQLTSLDLGSCTQLTSLFCYNNQLTSLNVSRNTALKSLSCSENRLTSLDVGNCTQLTYLSCYSNQLTSLDVSNNTALQTLSCGDNKLTSLSVANCIQLTNLSCYSNQLTSLDVSKNTALQSLSCGSNRLSNLNVGNCTQLTDLDCYNNQLTSLNVSNDTALEKLNLGSNKLTSLNIDSCTQLTVLYCYGNQLTAFDVSNNTALTLLNVTSNKLTSLNTSANTALKELWCSGNQLTSLDVSNNTALEKLVCSGNRLTSLDISRCPSLVSLVKSTTAVGNGNIVEYGIYSDNIYLSCDSGVTLKTTASSETSVAIDAASFPDATFRAYVKSSFDQNGDGRLSEEELDAVTMIDYREKGVTSFKGVEFFTNLTDLWCPKNQVTSLDLSRNTALKILWCDDNQLTSLDVSKNTALQQLWCANNKLTGLNVGNNTKLTHLHCQGNSLSSLDISKNTRLTELLCSDNQLTSLDLSRNTALQSLHCYNNKLTSLNVSKNTALTLLSVNGNKLTSLDTSVNTALKELWCANNNLSSLNVSKNTALEKLVCSNNRLTSLDISKCSSLVSLVKSTAAVENGSTVRYGSNSDSQYLLYDSGVTLKTSGSSVFFIGEQPVSQTVFKGETVSFRVGVYTILLGNPSFNYLWQVSTDSGKSWSDYTGAGTNTEQISFTATTQNGYQYRCRVSMGGDPLYSDAATLTVVSSSTKPDLFLPASLTSIEADAFAGGAFSFVKLSEKTAKIGARAFADCAKLKYIYIPAATKTIDSTAFRNVNGLTIYGHAGSYAETYANANGYSFVAVD